jgi:mannose-1-phosphate guanylyltransferase
MPDRILAEPCGRNTAPCIALAALRVIAEDPDATLLVLPADHVIAPTASFVADVGQAVDLLEADSDRLVLFGVPPTYPSTGFGYIRRGDYLGDPRNRSYAVDGFREKPDLETAESLLAAGGHLWNCGIFVWKARRILSALRESLPAIGPRLEQLHNAWQRGTFPAAIEEEFPRMPSISIDHAVLEKADRVCVVETSFTWDDVGSWQAIARHAPITAEGNTLIGRVCTTETTNCILRGSSDHLIAAIGVHDLIVVHTPDATLICDRRDESAIRRLREVLEANPETREFL